MHTNEQQTMHTEQEPMHQAQITPHTHTHEAVRGQMAEQVTHTDSHTYTQVHVLSNLSGIFPK